MSSPLGLLGLFWPCWAPPAQPGPGCRGVHRQQLCRAHPGGVLSLRSCPSCPPAVAVPALGFPVLPGAACAEPQQPRVTRVTRAVPAPGRASAALAGHCSWCLLEGNQPPRLPDQETLRGQPAGREAVLALPDRVRGGLADLRGVFSHERRLLQLPGKGLTAVLWRLAAPAALALGLPRGCAGFGASSGVGRQLGDSGCGQISLPFGSRWELAGNGAMRKGDYC